MRCLYNSQLPVKMATKSGIKKSKSEGTTTRLRRTISVTQVEAISKEQQRHKENEPDKP